MANLNPVEKTNNCILFIFLCVMFCKILYMPVLHLPFDYINIRFALSYIICVVVEKFRLLSGFLSMGKPTGLICRFYCLI